MGPNQDLSLPIAHQKKNPISIAVLMMLFAFAAAALWTYRQWDSRSVMRAAANRSAMWSIETAASENQRAFIRIQDTSYWVPRAYGLLTSDSFIAAQGAPVELKNPTTGSRIVLAPHSVVQIRRTNITVVSGLAHIIGPLKVRLTSGDHVVAAKGAALVYANGGQSEITGELEPRNGSTQELHPSETASGSLTPGLISFSWPKALASTGAVLEFARDPSFQTILFTQAASGAPHTSVNFSDRSPGAWFVRMNENGRGIAYTSFNLVESQTPDALRRLGRRWLQWRDRGLASLYRVEFSTSDTFQQIAHSFQIRNRELDLTQVPRGSYFARVAAISRGEKEIVSRPIAVQVQDKAEILSAGHDLNDPDLKLFARGWKIVLEHGEVSRIREGYVILRESELRGVKIAPSVTSRVVFELSRDENFSNPERVRPDSHGELLPPALPLGVLYARLRRIETDGTFGATGPASRLTTWLPAPLAGKPRSTAVQGVKGFEINWNLGTDVAGYELRLSPSREFAPETTHVIRTRALSRKIASPSLQQFYWTVTAINDVGQPVSMTSPIQEVITPKAKPEKIKTATLAKNSSRHPAMAMPSGPLVPMLQLPVDDAVIVGGATATKYGKLTWSFAGNAPTYEIQIATDGDFVNVIEKSKTKKPEFTLEGDLPEGRLFWRVRKAKSDDWSRARRFELVYE